MVSAHGSPVYGMRNRTSRTTRSTVGTPLIANARAGTAASWGGSSIPTRWFRPR